MTPVAAASDRVGPGDAGVDLLLRPGRPQGRAIRLGVISNPLSRRNQRGRALERIQRNVERSGQLHLRGSSLEEVVSATEQLLAAGVEVLAVNGGDGTVQAVLTGLLRAGLERRPLVAVLPGGTTNTTARNVGYGARGEHMLAGLLHEASQGRIEGRVEIVPAVRLDRLDRPESAPLFAMFFGAGAVYHGIGFAKSHVESRGVPGQLGAATALLVFLGRVLGGKGGSLFPPVATRIALDGGPPREELLTGLLVSTMERQFLGIHPYWGTEAGPLRFSSLGYPPRNIARAALPVMRGRPNRFVTPELGYRSHNATRIDIEMEGGYVLDGELWEPGGETSICLTAEETVAFLRPAPL